MTSNGKLRPASLALLCLMLLPAVFAAAQVPASLLEDAMDLRILCTASWRVLPSASSPLSGAASRLVLEDLRDGLTDESSGQVAEAIAHLDDVDVPMIDIVFSPWYEHYFRPSYPLGFAERLAKVEPFATLSMSYQTGLSLALVIQMDLLREFGLPDLHDNAFSMLPGNPVASENNSVRTGYLLYSADPLEIVFGRHEVSIGPSPLTSLVVSRAVPFLDALDVEVALGRLHMSLLVSTLENRLALDDVAIPGSSPYDFGTTVILHNIHYFEYDFGFLRLGVCGQVIINRPQNAFQIADFFPVFSWHNADIVPNNLTLTFDASVVPLPGLEVYAQYGFDDINASIIGAADASLPTIDAGLLGVAWRDRWADSSLEAILEAGFTHYLWGLFDDEVPLARSIYRMNLDGMGQWIPLSSPFGPGTSWILARAAVATPWNLDVVASFRLLWRNPLASLSGPFEADETVAAAHRDLSLQAGIELSYAPWKWIRVKIEPELHHRDGTTWVELTLGAGTTIEIGGRLAADHED